MRMHCSLALSALLGVPVHAAEMALKVEIPRLSVAEYHRPYTALWVERADRAFATNLAVWYDLNKKDNEGTKWLKDMRQWWRKSGRELQMPVDGLSGATRAPGEHALVFDAGKSVLGALPAGDYALVVEAAREGGGREVLRLPFQWPPTAAQHASARGGNELGTVTLDLRP